MSSRVFLDMLEDDPEDGYPSPEHLQLIQFEGCTSGVIALESYEELFNKAARLERERDEWKTKAILHGNAALELEEDLQKVIAERDSLRARVAELDAEFAEFKAMLKAACSQRFDTEIKTQWLVELPMTHEQVEIWDKHMNPKPETEANPA